MLSATTIPKDNELLRLGEYIYFYAKYFKIASLQTIENAYKRYIKSRPAASADSNRRVKELPLHMCAVHPIFKGSGQNSLYERENILDQMKSYRPQGTIFEICGKNKSQEYLTMKEKRAVHKDKIEMHKKLMQEKITENKVLHKPVSLLTGSTSEDIQGAFKNVIVPKKRKMEMLYKKTKKRKTGDEVFIPYAPEDRHTEEGLTVNNFQNDASRAQLDITGDSEEAMNLNKSLKKWDRKKKKMVTVENPRKGKIKTESGVWIPATYKSNRYAQWKERTKATDNNEDNDNDQDSSQQNFNQPKRYTHWAKHNEKVKGKQRKSEMKSMDQILKAREIAERKKQRQKKKTKGKGRRHKK